MATSRYSILFAHTRQYAGEQISIGLFLIGDDGRRYFNYSKDKLAAATHLMGDAPGKLLKESVRNIANAFRAESSTYSTQGTIDELARMSPFSTSYIGYLSRYNNNILSFEAPKEIDLTPDDNSFSYLFNLYVDERAQDLNTVPIDGGIENFLLANEPQFNRHFNRDRRLTSKDIPSLIAPVKVDAIGMNERPVIVQFLDLGRRVADIKWELAQVLLVNEAFEDRNQEPKTFLVAEEPPKIRSDQSAIWKQLRHHRKFTSLMVSEAGQILEYAAEHNVVPLVAVSNDQRDEQVDTSGLAF